jgi:phenylacetate-CoA ligase
MHISTETNYVEIIKDGVPAEPGQPGTVVVTCLTNYVFPFIRYRLDDVASMRAEPCPCGRAQPMLQVVEGRLVDMFRTRNGRTNIHSSLFEVQGIRQFQTVQKALDRVVVRLVVDDEFKDTYIKVIEERIQRNMGPETQVTCEFHDEIPTEPSGKYRYAVCEIEE